MERRSQTPALHERFVQMFSQECFFWKKDSSNPKHDLLVRYGFRRGWCPPATKRRCGYFLDLPGRRTVAIWNEGLFWGGNAGRGLILEHGSRKLWLTCSPQVSFATFSLFDIPRQEPSSADFDEVAANQMLTTAFRWIGLYEEWVKGAYGSDQKGLQKRIHCGKGGVDCSPGKWFTLARDYTTSIEAGNQPLVHPFTSKRVHI